MTHPKPIKIFGITGTSAGKLFFALDAPQDKKWTISYLKTVESEVVEAKRCCSLSPNNR
jgi:hypothetical protein